MLLPILCFSPDFFNTISNKVYRFVADKGYEHQKWVAEYKHIVMIKLCHTTYSLQYSIKFCKFYTIWVFFENTTILIEFKIYEFRIALSYFIAQIVFQATVGVFILCNEGSIFRDCVILHPYYVTHVDQNNAFQMKFRHSCLKWRCHFHQLCDPNTRTVVL